MEINNLDQVWLLLTQSEDCVTLDKMRTWLELQICSLVMGD